MTRFSFSIVGFDLDGTLLDTSGDLAAAVNHALARASRAPLSVGQVKPMIGGGARHMLAQALTVTGGCSEQQLHHLLPVLLEHYVENIAVQTRPFPHAIEVLETLREDGVRCAVVTNKREEFTHKLLQTLDLLGRFACVIGGDTLGVGRTKPKPDPILAMIKQCGGGRAAFVGDSIYDIDAGKAAGVPTVACAFGFLQQPVESLGADVIIHGFDELVPTLTRLGAR